MTTLLTRFLSRRPRAAGLTLTVYTRAGCCCCHKALELLQEHRSKWGYDIEEVNVDSDPDLAARYGAEIPVVRLGGKVRFRGKVNPALLDRLLTAEVRNRPHAADRDGGES